MQAAVGASTRTLQAGPARRPLPRASAASHRLATSPQCFAPTAPRRRQLQRSAAVGGGGGNEPGATPPPAEGLTQLVASPLYRVWLQLGVVLLLLMLIDAGEGRRR